MPQSEAFLRIRRDAVSVVREIPEGFITSYRAVGEHLDVMPRHIAYLLSQLEPEDREGVPWHRVVADKGLLSDKNSLRREEQRNLLMLEGVVVNSKGQVLNYLTHFLAPAVFSTVPAGMRPEKIRPTSK